MTFDHIDETMKAGKLSLLLFRLWGKRMISKVISGAVFGIESQLLTVETDISDGLPYFSMIGYVSGDVRECGERAKVALKNSGYEFPVKRVTVNISPASVRKRGIVPDLPVAVGILACMGVVPAESLKDVLFVGELGLDGQIKPVRGVLPVVSEAARRGIGLCILPADNTLEGSVISGTDVVGVRSLSELVEYLDMDREKRREFLPPRRTDVNELLKRSQQKISHNFSAIHGQWQAKRAMEIAAAGFHNLLMVGPPGSGKSTLARCMPGILPPMNACEAMEVTSIYSTAGKIPAGQAMITSRPFVTPHSSVTRAALFGGGIIPEPGDVSLADYGVLFMDEFPQFGRYFLDLLRQPLEDHSITIDRLGGSIHYPSKFLLLAAMNPCPCGNYPDLNRCSCTYSQIVHYVNRISGPLLDRIDMVVHVPKLDIHQLQCRDEEEKSEEIRERVMRCSDIQKNRYAGTPYRFNSDLDTKGVEAFCNLGESEQRFMGRIYMSRKMTARSYYRVIRLARTIADLDGSERIEEAHLSEAVSYHVDDLRRMTARRDQNYG